jgi:hypothetical protein
MFRSVTQSVRHVLDVVASVLTLGQEVAESFVARASRTLKAGEELTVAAVLSLQVAVVRMIEDARDTLEAAEKAHRKELRKEVELRERRDLEQEAVYREVLAVRNAMDGAFGKKTSEKLVGLDPGLGAVDVQVLCRYAWESVEVLSEPGFTMPDTALTKTPEEYASGVRVPLERLESTLVALAAQKRLTQKAQKVKNRALEVCRKTFRLRRALARGALRPGRRGLLFGASAAVELDAGGDGSSPAAGARSSGGGGGAGRRSARRRPLTAS